MWLGTQARRRVRRVAVEAVAVYVATVVAFHGVVGAGTVIARLQDRRPDRPASIPIKNFRRVDDRVWAAGQPDARQYRALAAVGVRVIVDVRTGAPDDPNKADRATLRRLGLEYVALPIRDGHVPDRGAVQRFVDVVERSNGLVLVHCGAGVGRSSTLAAGYLMARDGDISLGDTLALGSVTLEQGWFLLTGERNAAVRRISEALDMPRRGWSRLRSLL